MTSEEAVAFVRGAVGLPELEAAPPARQSPGGGAPAPESAGEAAAARSPPDCALAAAATSVGGPPEHSDDDDPRLGGEGEGPKKAGGPQEVVARAGPASGWSPSRRQQMARCLAAEALRLGTTDNVTVVVLWLK